MARVTADDLCGLEKRVLRQLSGEKIEDGEFIADFSYHLTVKSLEDKRLIYKGFVTRKGTALLQEIRDSERENV